MVKFLKSLSADSGIGYHRGIIETVCVCMRNFYYQLCTEAFSSIHKCFVCVLNSSGCFLCHL